MLIPESYYKDELNVKLTEQDIEMIIDELERQPHNLYEYQQTENLIKKLKHCQQEQVDSKLTKDLDSRETAPADTIESKAVPDEGKNELEAEVFGLGNALEDYKKENRSLRRANKIMKNELKRLGAFECPQKNKHGIGGKNG